LEAQIRQLQLLPSRLEAQIRRSSEDAGGGGAWIGSHLGSPFFIFFIFINRGG
jgi:hypothetical protein